MPFTWRGFRTLRDMDVIARDIIRNFGDKGRAGQMDNATENDSTVTKFFLSGLGDSVDTELENSQRNAAVEDQIYSSLRKIADGVKLRNKIVEKNTFRVS